MKMEEGSFLTALKVIFSLVLAGLVVIFTRLSHALILKPRRIRSKLERQGIRGPLPVILYGNIPEMRNIQLRSRSTSAAPPLQQGGIVSHAWPATVFPHIEQWRNEYGPTFMYSTGNIQVLCILDPGLVKELSLFTSMNLGKPSYLSTERGPLLGQGILTSNGPYWAHQRKVIAPEFYLDKIKDIIPLMVNSTTRILQSWESKTENQPEAVEIRVDQDMRSLSADIISRACFGSSYSQGERIHLKLHSLENLMSQVNLGVPGLRHVPTKVNREIWRLQKDIDSMILKIVKARRETSHEKDLLQSILDAAKSDEDKGDRHISIAPDRLIIDNCKNVYFAGYETTAISASWCLMLLAAYPEWQACVRKEVLELIGTDPPDADQLRSMKKLTMVIQETLRLYPPVANVMREALQDINITSLQIPQGVNVQIIIPFLHQHPQLWGPDVHQFNPERFSMGITRACKIPQAYMPFGVGTRICAGQHFAMAELKVILSLILSRFNVSLSSEYRHSPVFRLVIQAEDGVILYLATDSYSGFQCCYISANIELQFVEWLKKLNALLFLDVPGRPPKILQDLPDEGEAIGNNSREQRSTPIALQTCFSLLLLAFLVDIKMPLTFTLICFKFFQTLERSSVLSVAH